LEVLAAGKLLKIITATVLTTTGSQLKGFLTLVIVIIKKFGDAKKTLCLQRKHQQGPSAPHRPCLDPFSPPAHYLQTHGCFCHFQNITKTAVIMLLGSSSVWLKYTAAVHHQP
jgi:hypothetical protein